MTCKIVEIDIAELVAQRGTWDIFIEVGAERNRGQGAGRVLIRNGVLIALSRADGGLLSVDGKRYHLSHNDILILPENHVIEYHDVGTMRNFSLIAVTMDYVLNMPSPIDTNIFGYARYHSVLHIEQSKYDDLMSYYNFIAKECGEQSRYQREIISSIFYALLLELLAEYEKWLDSDATTHIKANDHSDRFFRELATHFRRERSVQFYADRLSLTPKYLSTLIKRTTGRPILRWIHEAVLIEAKMLLRTTDLTVQEISEQLNFSSPSAFVQFFKKQTGKSPKQMWL